MGRLSLKALLEDIMGLFILTTIALVVCATINIYDAKQYKEQKYYESITKSNTNNKYDDKKPIEKVEEKNEIHPLFGGTVEIDDVEYEVKMNRYCEYEFVPKKKSDVAILCEEYEKLKKQKKQLEEKKQLMLDRSGVQLTIDDWTKQQAKDKERQEAIDAIKNKDGQISFFNEITEEQIQEQIENKRRQERELFKKKMEEDKQRHEQCKKDVKEAIQKLKKMEENRQRLENKQRQERESFRKKVEEDRQRHEQWKAQQNEWAKEMNKKFEEQGLEIRLSLFEQDIDL
jgi:hypothetical protein